MIDLQFRNEEYVTPPGTLTEILAHPHFYNSRTIELSIFYEHRYAFFFWLKWATKFIGEDQTINPPALVTLDWHQDLCEPDDNDDLNQLDINNNAEVSFFSWAKLNPNNDGHILSAAYLNKIGNIYVHCRQGNFSQDWEDKDFYDLFGNVHKIRKYKTFEDMENFLLTSDETAAFFDLDLDFFTVDNPYNGKGDHYSYLTDEEITTLLNPKRPLIQWLFERLRGFTIAIEPEHTGGLAKANRYLDLINSIYFDPPLFTNHGSDWSKSTDWRHLSPRSKR